MVDSARAFLYCWSCVQKKIVAKKFTLHIDKNIYEYNVRENNKNIVLSNIDNQASQIDRKLTFL